MGKQIPKNVKVAAMKSYVADGKTLRDAAMAHGVNPESLRRWLGSKVRKRGAHLRGKRRVIASTPAPMTPATISMVSRKPRTSKASPENTRSNKRWTQTEDELLRDAVLSKMTVKETVELLGRTSVAIYCRKNYLIDNGFINESTKFVMPSGIKRVRKPMETPYDGAEVEAIVEDMPTPHVELKAADPVKPASNIDLTDLAKLVKEFGVNVTLNVTERGMEVKMTN